MIRLCFRKEIKQRYSHKVQKLCRTSGFGLIKNNQSGDPNQASLENLIFEAKELAPIMTSLVFGIIPILRSLLTSHLALMKLLAILVIICKSAYWNNSNYVSLLMAMYIYSADAKVDAITFLNCFNLFVLYNMLLRKWRGITTSNAAFIKEQASNCKLIGMWDNFKYWENIAEKKIGDIVKFRSVTMALWIKNR